MLSTSNLPRTCLLLTSTPQRQSTIHQMLLPRKHTEAVANGTLAATNASREAQEGELGQDPDAFRRYSQCIFKNLHKKGEQCRPGTLWGKVVDPVQYEFGCKEIEVRCSIPRLSECDLLKVKSSRIVACIVVYTIAESMVYSDLATASPTRPLGLEN